MKKEIKELWNELQGLDEESQLDLLQAFAEHMFHEGVTAQDENDDENLWDVAVAASSRKL